VNSESLPYSLETLAFPFPALAALAGRLPLGSGREVALASLLVARLALGTRGPLPMSAPDRVARAASSKVWLASLALPAATRVPFARCVEATASSPIQIISALRSLIAATAQHLDGPAIQELEQLTRSLDS
jgi:hypothetical protein